MTARPLAYSYVRFSTPQQAEGNSYVRQTDRAEAWSKQKSVKLDDKLKFEDLGVSAFKGANLKIGALKSFVDAVKGGRVKRGSYLLVESLDRLSRNEIRHALQLLLDLIDLGIVVVTLDNGVEYDENVDTMKMLQALMSFGRANEESKVKSYRVDNAWKQKKEDARTKKKPLGKQTPGWIELVDGEYRLIPDKAATVRELFKLTIEGMGRSAIARRFNQDKKNFPPLRHGRAWHFSYVAKILANRACIGEYQPHIGHAGRERKPVGDPVVGYYPAVVSEATFYKASAAVERRRGKQRGRVGERVNNLFTGLVFDARSGSTMVYMDKGSGSKPVLVPSACIRGERDYTCAAYEPLEKHMLTEGWDFDPEKFFDKQEEEAGDGIEAAEAEHADIRQRIEKLQAALETGDIDALLPVIGKLESRRKEVEAKLETQKRAKSDLRSLELRATIDVLRTLDEADEEERARLRRKLQDEYKRIVERIDILPYWRRGKRAALYEVTWKDDSHGARVHTQHAFFSDGSVDEETQRSFDEEDGDRRECFLWSYHGWDESQKLEETKDSASEDFVRDAATAYANGVDTPERIALYRTLTGWGRNHYLANLAEAKKRKLVEPLTARGKVLV